MEDKLKLQDFDIFCTKCGSDDCSVVGCCDEFGNYEGVEVKCNVCSTYNSNDERF